MAGLDVAMCTAKDCRRADGFRTVQRELKRAGDLRELPCLDVCDGPVVVLGSRGDDAVVIERVRSRALALELIDHAVAGAPLSGRLRKRRLTGTKQAKARRRLRRI
jgi:hypothetical protein